jgi:hypothetical protein
VHTPESNGLSERTIRTVWESGYAMLLASSLPLAFWYHAACYASIIANCLPTNTALGYMSPMQAKYGVVPDVHRFRVFGCIAFIHIDKSQRESTLVEKAYEGYFIGFPDYPNMEKYAVYVPALDDVLISSHVIFDEVTTVTRPAGDGLLTISNEKQSVNDFKFLINHAYVDDETNIKFITTRVSVSRGFIVAYRAPILNGVVGQEEHRPVHAKDVERMLNKHLMSHPAEIYINNKLTVIADASQVAQQKPASHIERPDQPIGGSRPTLVVLQPSLEQLGAGTESSDAMREPRASQSLSQVTELSELVAHGSVPSMSSSSVAAHDTNVLLPAHSGGTDSVTEGDMPDGLSGRRQRTKRQPLNVGSLGDIKDKLYYLASSPVDQVDDKDSVWNDAKVDELHSIIVENDVWDTVPLPPDKTPITTKWVVKEKTFPVQKRKARYTTRGFSQKKGEDYNETYAPVAKLTTLRIFLTLVAIFSLFTRQLDVKTAFLNARVAEDIYISPSYDLIDLMYLLYDREHNLKTKAKIKQQILDLKLGHVCKLKKALYGLKQAPRNWYQHLDGFLQSIGFTPNKSEPCLYSLKHGDNFALLLLYVDDIIIAASTEQLAVELTNKIGRKFRISNEGTVCQYLNMTIEHQRNDRTITITMEKYVDKMCQRFQVSPKASVLTPMQENLHLELEEEPAVGSKDAEYIKNFQYREKVGSILYYMICMRPDIAYAVSIVSKYCERPTMAACRAVTRILQYCLNTKDAKLTLGGLLPFIIAFFDSDWAADILSRRSYGGHIVFLGFGPVDWSSKMSKLVCNSTAEAEFIAANAPAKSIQWIRWLLHNTGISKFITRFSSALCGDNQAAIAMASNPVHHQRTKHIAIKYYYIRDLVEYCVIHLIYVESGENVADIFTKPLGRVKFLYHRKRVLGGFNFIPNGKRQRTAPSDEYV